MGVSIVMGDSPNNGWFLLGKILLKWMGSPSYGLWNFHGQSIYKWMKTGVPYCRKHPYGWKFHGDVLGLCGDGSDVGNSRCLHSRWFGPSVHGFEREAGWLWLAKSDKGIPKQPSLPWRIVDTTDHIWLVVTGCHEFYFPINIGLRLSSQLTKSYFSEGWPNHQPGLFISHISIANNFMGGQT